MQAVDLDMPDKKYIPVQTRNRSRFISGRQGKSGEADRCAPAQESTAEGRTPGPGQPSE